MRRFVVAVEFRNEKPRRSFDSLLKSLPADDVVKIDPLDYPSISSQVYTLSEQASHWDRLLRKREGNVAAVLGYCSGAALAYSLTLECVPENVPLILLDPVWTSPDVAQDLLFDLCRGMDSKIREDSVPRVGHMPPDEALAVAGVFLRSSMERVAGELPEDILDALTEKQRAWFSYTLSATSSGSPLSPCHVFLSDAGNSPEGDAHVRRVSADAWELFESTELADAVGRIVHASRAAGGVRR